MYFKLNTIKAVLKALTSKEIETIRPCFGKILDLYSKPVFSGKLAHFLLTRQMQILLQTFARDATPVVDDTYLEGGDRTRLVLLDVDYEGDEQLMEPQENL
ncbi:hypothetical protein ISN45_Aa02g009250 [Arabidopsis thaliana x Arabidopsis arenosa]|uniref:Uncharacterized protein n=1 Tax=Arabidopsis thaliana x Arabidopsis arenosa TaxID=1240361 RepID=A0A8T2BI31_9BRAS|nr:hypothetical protein ISN45_Aa02g009250 [Arabidopsis thaliana x Arabidopsis arenosa]